MGAFNYALLLISSEIFGLAFLKATINSSNSSAEIIPPSFNYKFITTFLIIVPVVAIVCKIKIYKVLIAYTITTLIHHKSFIP